MWTIVLLCVFLGVGGLLYTFYLKPKRLIAKFAQKAEAEGFRVKLYPFKLMDYYLIKVQKEDDSSMKPFKEDLCNYDLVVGNMFSRLSVLPIHRDLLKDFYNQLPKLPKNPLITNAFQLINGGGLVFSEGAIWKRKRKIISSVFHFGFLNSMIPTIEADLQKECNFIESEISKGKTVDLRQLFVRLFSGIIAKVFFGTDMASQMVEGKPYCEFYVEFLDELVAFVSTPEYLLFGTKLYRYGITKTDRQIKRKIKLLTDVGRHVVLNEIEKAKKGEQLCKNMITALYEAGQLDFQNPQGHEQKYSIDELIGEFLTFFGAGTDTTSNALNLLLHYLSQNAEVHRKVLEEIESVQSLKVEERLRNMKWVDAVLNEALRLNGPSVGLFPRVAIEDVKLGNLVVPKGSSISQIHTANHYKEDNFPNSSQFRPQRWLGEAKMEPFMFTGFGGGERNCIGQHLARIEVKVVLSKLLPRYEIKAMNQIQMKAGFVFGCKSGEFSIGLRKQGNQ